MPRSRNIPRLLSFRRRLRADLTPSEATLWKRLKGRQLEGRKFRRQFSIGRHILDFFCPEEKLAIELDGNSHGSEGAMEQDRERDAYLKSMGIRTLRFENEAVRDDVEWVLERIKGELGKGA